MSLDLLSTANKLQSLHSANKTSPDKDDAALPEKNVRKVFWEVVEMVFQNLEVTLYISKLGSLKQ